MFKFKEFAISLVDTYVRLEQANSNDIKMLNTTPPFLVRYLGKDNLYRTFNISQGEVAASIKVSATKTDDLIKHIDEFVKAIKIDKAHAIANKEAIKKQKQKQEQLNKLNIIEAEFHRKRSGGEFTDEEMKEEMKKLSELREKVHNNEEVTSEATPWNPKTPMSRRERAKKMRAAKKSKSKKLE